MTAQKIRIWYRKGARLRFTSHLDVLRAWERAMRRAGVPLAYSEGFTPHPKLAFSSPLPLGFEGEAEVMDATLTERVDVANIGKRLQEQTVDDLMVTGVAEIPVATPSPQAAMRAAEYRVDLPAVTAEEAARRVESFLARAEFPWTEERHERRREYDLRASVIALAAGPAPGCGTRLTMQLRSDQEFTGRPEQVVAAVFPGDDASCYVRTRIVLEHSSPARDAWRRVGRYQ